MAMAKYLSASVVAAGLALAPAVASAVTVTGTTTGAFGGVPCSGAPTTCNGLSFNNGAFSGNTVNGMYGIGGNSSQSLGQLVLNSTVANYSGATFTLNVTLSSPAGTTPSPGMFSGQITGAVTSTNDGGVFVNFGSGPVQFTGGDGTVLFFSVNNTSVTPGQASYLSGTVMAVPEPATWAMMLVGFAMVGGVSRYRRKATKVAYA